MRWPVGSGYEEAMNRSPTGRAHETQEMRRTWTSMGVFGGAA